MTSDKRRARIRWALNQHLTALEQANKLVRLRDVAGRPIQTYEVQRRRIRHRHDMFIDTLMRWSRRHTSWGMKPRKSDGVIVYGPHYDQL